MADKTPQELGFAWDYEVARRAGGRRQSGSGNRPYAQLDAATGLVLMSGKLTVADSIRVSNSMIDEATRAVAGPEAMTGGYDSVLVLNIGGDINGPAVAVLDFELLLSWMKAPPGIIPATKHEEMRATSRVPPFLR